jgi:hypothetical protein
MSEHLSIINPFIRGPAADRVKRYRERAERLRGMADDFSAPEWQEILLRLADSYEGLAEATEDQRLVFSN